ncbi:MAG: glycosyltransferase family 4 protein, partial [Thermoanaerobaculia bacterium]
EETLERLRAEASEAYITLLIDGPEWESVARAWAPRFPNRREIRPRRASDLPQTLLEAGVEGSAHAWLAFLWPGCGVSGAGLRALRGAAGEADLVYGDAAGVPPAGLFHPVQPGWLEMADLIPMENCLLAKNAYGRLGRFEASPWMRRTFWRDFTLRLSRAGRLEHAPVASPGVRWDWKDFPFAGPEVEGPAAGAALKVTLLSALHDAHQNELFFHTFFRRAAGEVAWRTVLYERCGPADLAGRDLVIFSRPRFPEVPALLDLCAATGVPALVMIDDNWIAAGQEFPRFEALFTPGKPAFETFLEALRRADATLVFNPVLEAEVRPYARRVLRLPASVDLSLFAAEPIPKEGLLVGFAGSPRWEASGFRGLARFLERRGDARLLVMAHEMPEELRGVPPERAAFLPWRHDYAAYARALAGQRPDVLIAPLDASRFSASKIPIKFLESAAVGAAGIYSRVPPYTDFVRDGETGLLVENTEEAWEQALERLAGDAALRRGIAARALAEVRERYATEKVLPAFLEALRSVAKG